MKHGDESFHSYIIRFLLEDWSWAFLFKVLIEWVLLDVESYIGAAYRSVFKPDFF